MQKTALAFGGFLLMAVCAFGEDCGQNLPPTPVLDGTPFNIISGPVFYPVDDDSTSTHGVEIFFLVQTPDGIKHVYERELMWQDYGTLGYKDYKWKDLVVKPPDRLQGATYIRGGTPVEAGHESAYFHLRPVSTGSGSINGESLKADSSTVSFSVCGHGKDLAYDFK
jgi:hypothetical protein